MQPLPGWQLVIALVALMLLGRLLAGALRRAIGVLARRLTHAATPVGTRLRAIAARWPRARRLATARLRTDRFSGLGLTLCTLLATYLAFLASGLVEDVVEQDAVVGFDRYVNQALAILRDPTILHLFASITSLADMATLVAVTLVAIGFLWADRRPAYIPGLLLTIIGSQAMAYLGKYLIDRARPDFLTFASAQTPSFPSGHATGAIAVYGFIAYAIARDIPGVARRFELGYWTLWLIALIAASRAILSVHYASDIAAGLLLGGFWLLAGAAVTELMRERAPAR